ncbi:MAG TPA: hypothetical protein GX011_04820 [Clostridiales bacterium]|nr:hypothetical protein [Clostridiales bacterium]
MSAEDIKKEAYVEVDRNMLVETSIKEPDVAFFDVRKPPFELYGFYDPHGQEYFRRLPQEVAEATSQGVAKLARESTGGRVRFSTDSAYIAIKVELGPYSRRPHMTLCNTAGFDLYEDTATDSRFVKPFLPPYNFENDYEQIIQLGSRKMRSFTINFPVHALVKNLYIGLQVDAALDRGKKYSNSAPVVFYGSSIVHGTAASRPGLTYENIISRRLNLDYINLGFSGRAKGEPVLIEYISGLNMSIFVCDYDHNAPDAAFLRATHQGVYDIFRKKQPDTPYIMISRPNIATNPTEFAERRDVIIDTYRHALSLGDKNVYYIDGESFFLGKYENECTMDGVHPNDLGFTLMADGIESVIRRILGRDCI